MPGSVYQGNDMNMKINQLRFVGLAANLLFATCLPAQTQQENDSSSRFQERIAQAQARLGHVASPSTDLKRFDLKFNGGTPKEFVEAIKQQSGLSVNVIIPTEYATVDLPSIEVHNVTIPQLFDAITLSSKKTTPIWINESGQRRKVAAESGNGFRSADATPTENSIWYFFSEIPTNDPPPTEMATVQVFQLNDLLKDYTIDDITTAVKTTWQMLDSEFKPEMKFHSETGLLVTKGTNQQLSMISQVLQQLRQAKYSPPTSLRRPGSSDVPTNRLH